MPEEKIIPAKTIHQFCISDVTMLLLTGKITKAKKFVVLLLTISTKFQPYFQTWETGGQPKLAHAYYVSPLWTTELVRAAIEVS